MIIYVDENISPFIARGLDQLANCLYSRDKIKILSVKDEFPGILDPDLIPIIGKNNSCLITQDYHVRFNHHEAELCKKYDLGVFHFHPPGKNGFKNWDLVKLIIKHWESITKKAIKEERPFYFRITSRGQMDKVY
jgi:hypothetical protein